MNFETHLENAPRNSGQEIPDQDHGQVLGEEENEDTSSHCYHSNHVHCSVSISGLGPTVDEETNDLTTRGCVVHSSLPIGRNQSLAAFCVVRSELLDERALTEEIVDLSKYQPG